MSAPRKIDVEVRGGFVVAVWFGCLHLPFEQHWVDASREYEMIQMYADMYKHINDNTYKPTDLLQERLEGQAYGYDENGKVQRPIYTYAPPPDEITSREA